MQLRRACALLTVCAFGVVGGAEGAAASTPPDNGLAGAALTWVTIDPRDGAHVLVGGRDGRWESHDAGAMWASVGWRGPAVFDPAHAGVVYMLGVNGHVLRSDDGGATTSPVFSFPSATDGAAAITVADSGRVFVALNFGGVVYSDDGGATWTDASGGLPALDYDTIHVQSFATAASGTAAYAALSDGSTYRWLDGGAWQPVAPVGGCAGEALTVSPADDQLVLGSGNCGLERSADGGATWNPVSHPAWSYQGRPVAVDPTDPSTMYVPAGIGVAKSTDGGLTFGAPVDVFQDEAISRAAVDPDDSSVLYATTHAGAFRSADGGDSWTPDNHGLLSDYFVESTASDPVDPSIVYAGTAGGFWRSADGGASWQYSESGLAPDTFDIASITVDPRAPATLYVQAVTDYFVSHDEGRTWSHLTTAFAAAGPVAIDLNDSSHLVVPTGSGVKISMDGGQTFVYDQVTGPPFPAITRAAVAPDDSSTIYAAGADGVWRSLDGGSSWTPIYVAGMPSRATVLAVDPTSPGTIYFGAETNQLEVSRDGGGTWHATGPSPFSFTDLTLDPSTTPATAFASNRIWLWRSTDAGETWIPNSSTEPAGVDETALADEAPVAGVAVPERALYLATSTVEKQRFVAATALATVRPLTTAVRAIRAVRGVVTLRVHCADSWAAACAGSLQLRRLGVTNVRKAFSIPQGTTVSVSLRLSQHVRRLLASGARLRFTALAFTQGADRRAITGRQALRVSA